MHPGRAIRLLAALGFFLASARSAAAQGAPPSASGAIWFGYAGDHAVAGRLGVTLDGSLRMSGELDAVRQLLLRPGLSFALTRAVKASAGYAYLSTEATDALGELRVPEHRGWGMLQLSHGLFGAAATHRLRLEQRYQRLGRAGAPWTASERARYQMRVAVPVGRTTYVALADELFASFGGAAASLDVDQNRATVSLGARTSATTRVEVGYLNQALAHAGSGLAVRTHVLQLSLASTLPFRD
jgi:hypothetical protein